MEKQAEKVVPGLMAEYRNRPPRGFVLVLVDKIRGYDLDCEFCQIPTNLKSSKAQRRYIEYRIKIFMSEIWGIL